jgi:glycosyltransferase involved in cell wall biosynthesis
MRNSDKKLCVAIVTTLMPETHYSRYLIKSLYSNYKSNLLLNVYSPKEEKLSGLEEININQCWSQNFLYPLQIVTQVIKDKVDIVHLQFEINMYGGKFMVTLFPILLFLLKLARKKIVITLHAVIPMKDIDLDFLEIFSLPRNNIVLISSKIVLLLLYKLICMLSDKIIVHSNSMRSTLVLDYNVSIEKVHVIPHGIPKRNFPKEIRKTGKFWSRIKDSNRIILYFGYVSKRKGLEYLIEAFKQVSMNHPDHILVISGGILPGQESYVANLRKKIEREGLTDKVIFTGFITENELEGLFISSEFVVLPTVCSISASGSLAQAISFYKPVVSVDTGYMHDEIEHGKEGLLCKPKDAESLAKAMSILIENISLRHKITENIAKKSKEKEWSHIAEKTYELYNSLNC